MSELFDDITRVVAAPVSRRQALKLIAGAVGAVFLNRLFGPQRPTKAQDYCDGQIYTHPCADICCRDDYTCASTTLLNGMDTYGICCYQTGTHLCSAGGYGWCCDTSEACGVERYSCVCATGYETCGNACCNTGAGEICCDPDHSLCCASGVECCYDASDNGTCCPAGTECVPASPTGWPPGKVCCPDDRACKGQCCPDGEMCQGNLACCPAERITPDRNGCCPAGMLYHLPSHSCCLEGLFCGDVCCTPPMVCRDGTCQACPSGQGYCFDTCCATGTCCFGKCCAAGQICTGECTKLETINTSINPSTGGTLTSTDGGVTISFMGLGTQETVTYTSQAQPSHPLPRRARHLRSFRLTHPAGSPSLEQVDHAFYTMHVSYTEATLAAMGYEQEAALKLLWWDASSAAWMPLFFPTIDRSAEEVITTQGLLGEFALVLVEWTVQLPLVLR